ncbi:hypothetical protein N7488_009243 [Penicillium malachiteum]|nr:hypothetical protein N7488_009243 [Penicillium malachiteum]
MLVHPSRTGGGRNDAFHFAAEAGQEGVIDLFLSQGYFLPGKRSVVLRRKVYLDTHNDLLKQRSPTRNECVSKTSEDALYRDVDTLEPAASLFEFGDILQDSGPLIDSQSDMPPPVYQAGRSCSLFNDQHSENEPYALEATAARGYFGAVKIILAQREQLGIQVFHLGKALLAASKSGHTGVIEAILSTSSDLRSFIL